MDRKEAREIRRSWFKSVILFDDLRKGKTLFASNLSQIVKKKYVAASWVEGLSGEELRRTAARERFHA